MSVEAMSLEAFYEAVFAHPGPWTEDEYFALPETPARPGHIRNPDVVLARRGAMSLHVPATDILLLVEITSPGNFRQDRIVKHSDYAAAGIPFYLRVDLESGPDALDATLFELAGGSYREAARSVDGMLRSSAPWPFEADLRALAKGRR